MVHELFAFSTLASSLGVGSKSGPPKVRIVGARNQAAAPMTTTTSAAMPMMSNHMRRPPLEFLFETVLPWWRSWSRSGGRHTLRPDSADRQFLVECARAAGYRLRTRERRWSRVEYFQDA